MCVAMEAAAAAVCVWTGADPAAVAVMMEDGAAVAGLFIAGGCLALCQVGRGQLNSSRQKTAPAAAVCVCVYLSHSLGCCSN